jgi:hypothetical protein
MIRRLVKWQISAVLFKVLPLVAKEKKENQIAPKMKNYCLYSSFRILAHDIIRILVLEIFSHLLLTGRLQLNKYQILYLIKPRHDN